MAKYVPHLRELLPTVPFLSAAYAATEGMFGIQSVSAQRTAPVLSCAPCTSNIISPLDALLHISAANFCCIFTRVHRTLNPPHPTHPRPHPQQDLIEYWAVHKAAQAEGAAPAPSYADFRQEPDGENSYVLMPGTGGWASFERVGLGRFRFGWGNSGNSGTWQ